MTSTRAKGLLVVQMEVDPGDVEELDAWYWEEHIPERLACPGFLSARRFRATEAPPRFIALYELEDISALSTPEYRAAIEHATPRTRAVGAMARIVRTEYVELTDPNKA